MINFDFRCDFERDNCLWDVSIGSQLSWERYRADVIPYQQRPPYDHTTRSQRVCSVNFRSIEFFFVFHRVITINYVLIQQFQEVH
jgi:hypothetical protein